DGARDQESSVAADDGDDAEVGADGADAVVDDGAGDGVGVDRAGEGGGQLLEAGDPRLAFLAARNVDGGAGAAGEGTARVAYGLDGEVVVDDGVVGGGADFPAFDGAGCEDAAFQVHQLRRFVRRQELGVGFAEDVLDVGVVVEPGVAEIAVLLEDDD